MSNEQKKVLSQEKTALFRSKLKELTDTFNAEQSCVVQLIPTVVTRGAGDRVQQQAYIDILVWVDESPIVKPASDIVTPQ